MYVERNLFEVGKSACRGGGVYFKWCEKARAKHTEQGTIQTNETSPYPHTCKSLQPFLLQAGANYICILRDVTYARGLQKNRDFLQGTSAGKSLCFFASRVLWYVGTEHMETPHASHINYSKILRNMKNAPLTSLLDFRLAGKFSKETTLLPPPHVPSLHWDQ